jgi:3-oxoacyl-[acyl-carrier-protein] synthase II
MNGRRVVVTGIGAVTPLGNSLSEFWENIKNGRSGAAQITKFDKSRFKTQFACEVKNFAPERYLDRNEIKRTDLFAQYALYATSEAMADCGIDMSGISPFDFGVIWGCGQGGMSTFEEEITNYALQEFEPRFSPFFVPKMITNMAAGLISMKFGLMGINYTTVSACATSNTAIMDAFNYIRFGKAKMFVTGGSEAPITGPAIGGFGALRALSTRNEDPEAASRPFDVGRDGFVMGEGAGALILEEYEHAKKRGAKIYAEVVAAAMTADAYHMTASHPEGLGAAKSMELALEEAGINPEQVDYLNTHATSTPVGDISETKAIQKVFGSKPDNLKVSATKSMTGHLLGAAGAIEGIICIKSITDNLIPPTINTIEIDPQIDPGLQIVTGTARETKVEYAMSNAFGFGGHNSTVLFKKI